MSASINGLGIPLPPTAPAASGVGPGSAPGSDTSLFGDLLAKSLGQVNGLEELRRRRWNAASPATTRRKSKP